MDFIPLITESGSIMFSMVKDEVEQQWELSPLDRCDRCNAEALVRVAGISGELMFCGHHYNKIEQVDILLLRMLLKYSEKDIELE